MGILLWLEPLVSSSATWLLTTSIKLIPVLVAVLLLRRYAGMSLSLPMRQLIGGAVLFALVMPFGWHLQAPPQVKDLFAQEPGGEGELQNLSLKGSLASGANRHIGVAPEHASGSGSRSNEPQVLEPQIDLPVYSVNSLKSISIVSVLGEIWFLGFTISVALLLRSFWCLAGVKRRSVGAAQATSNIFVTCSSAINLRKSVKLRVSGEVGSPMVVGWLRPVVLVPKTAELLPVDQLRHIFLHELTHVKRGDVLFFWLVTGVVFLHWFNPLVWRLAKGIRADMEVACDRDALSYLQDSERTAYGKTLVELASAVPIQRFNMGSVGVLDNHKELAARIKFITRQGRLSFVTIISTSCLFFASVAVALSQPKILTASQYVHSQGVTSILGSSDIEAVKAFIERGLQRRIIVKETHKRILTELDATYASKGSAEFFESLFPLGFSAYELGGAVYVEKLKSMRNAPIPFYDFNSKYSDYQFLTAIIPANDMCVKNFVELRRIIPSYSHISWSGDQLLVSTYHKNLLEVMSKMDSLGCRV